MPKGDRNLQMKIQAQWLPWKTLISTQARVLGAQITESLRGKLILIKTDLYRISAIC